MHTAPISRCISPARCGAVTLPSRKNLISCS